MKHGFLFEYTINFVFRVLSARSRLKNIIYAIKMIWWVEYSESVDFESIVIDVQTFFLSFTEIVSIKHRIWKWAKIYINAIKNKSNVCKLNRKITALTCRLHNRKYYTSLPLAWRKNEIIMFFAAIRLFEIVFIVILFAFCRW